MITIYIPGFPQKTYECRYGDAQIIHDDKGHAIVIDGGEPTICNKLIAYCRNKRITNVTYILTHWHIDHDTGMKAFLDVKGICVDRIYCPPPSELSGLQEEGVSGDYSRAQRRISQAKSLGKTIIYPPARCFTDITVGEIKCRIWRRSARKADQNDREVNNTSMQTYFPDLWYLSGGDMIDKQDFLRTKPGPAVIMKGYHHGNGDGKADLQTLKTWGVQLYWYNDVEPKGKGIGSTSFSQWGAGKAKGLITTVLRTDSDIVMTAANGKLKVQKGSDTWTFDVPYHGKGFEGWCKIGDKWCYQYADGSYAVGWAKLGWSKGTDWFYFNPANGVMLTGWVYTGGFWYWLDPATGAMQVGWLQYHGKWCYLEPVAGKNQGHAYCNQTATIDGKTYIFDRDCYATEIKAGSVSGKLNEISASRRQFVQNIAQLVREYATQYGVKVYSPIIAQAILESGWGESTLAYKYHNYFGLKCGTLWKGKSVSMKTGEEYTPGTHTTISANFRVYDSMEEGVKGYFVFLFDGRTRYDNLKGVTDPRTYLQNIKSDGYATSSKYVDNCMNLVNTYSLTQFDGCAEPAGKYPRADIVSLAQSFVGTVEGGTIHHRIIDKYNEHRPLPRGYKVRYSDAWCATFCSYLAIACGYTAIIPVECGCPQWITLAKGMGSWTESDTYAPKPGDFVLYDWQDSGSGDNTGTPDHIGIVEKVDGKTITVIEGNYNDSVKRRQIQIGGKYIRGYVTPKYSD